MKVHKGYKFRLEPTEEQKVKINKTLGCCRFVYNSMLDRRIKAYQRRGESMSYIDTQNLLPQMKTYLPWLAEVDSQALKYSCRQLNNAYKGFFEDGKGFPQFKRKRGEESYTTTKAKSIKVDDKYIKKATLPGLNSAGTTAAIIVAAMNDVPAIYIEKFMDVFYSGFTNNEAEHYAIALRDELLRENRVKRGTQYARFAFFRTANRLNQYYKTATGQRVAKRVNNGDFPYNVYDANGGIVKPETKKTKKAG